MCLLTFISCPGGRETPFIGIKKSIDIAMLGPKDFHKLHRNKEIKKTWELTETWDVTNGGEYYIFMSGRLPIAADGPSGDSANITGMVSYTSNVLHFKIHSSRAQDEHRKQIEKRLRDRSEDKCSDDQRADIEKSRSECHRLASLAAQAAFQGPEDRMLEYFQSADSTTRQMVATVFSLMAQECGPERNPLTMYSCSKQKYYCHETSLAYTWPDEGVITYCPNFFEYPLMEDSCDDLKSQPYSWYNQEKNGCTDGGRRWLWLVCMALDGEKHHRRMTNTNQALVTMRSMTQLADIVAAETFGTHYGDVRNMTLQENLFNSDTYALFALSVGLTCPVTLNASLPVGLVKNMPSMAPGLVDFAKEELESAKFVPQPFWLAHWIATTHDLANGAD